MRVVIKEWRRAELVAEVESTLAVVGEEYAAYTRSLFNEVGWDWPNDTLRFESANMGGVSDEPASSGVWVWAGPRDIVDTGELRDSMKGATVREDGFRLVLSLKWTAPYAMNVITGGPYGEYYNPRGTWVEQTSGPARDWISVAMGDYPAHKLFTSVWRAARA